MEQNLYSLLLFSSQVTYHSALDHILSTDAVSSFINLVKGWLGLVRFLNFHKHYRPQQPKLITIAFCSVDVILNGTNIQTKHIALIITFV